MYVFPKIQFNMGTNAFICLDANHWHIHNLRMVGNTNHSEIIFLKYQLMPIRYIPTWYV